MQERQENHPLIQTFATFQETILGQLAEIRADVSLLASAAGKRRLDPQFLPLDEAARLAGRSKQGLQNLIKRELAKPDGFPIKRIHGAVHRADLLRFLEHLAAKHPGRGARVRQALSRLQQ